LGDDEYCYDSGDDDYVDDDDNNKQESLAIAKTTARCAQYMGALKVSRVLANAPGYFSRNL